MVLKCSSHGGQRYLLLGSHAWLRLSPLDSFINNGWLGDVRLKCFCLLTQQELEILCAFELYYTKISSEILLNSAEYLSNVHMRL